ncbi:hypothetical protein BDZ94DRAFT_396148 [Collybia nuda]|uniref:Uncharacterized protein n=1 Tax=Collybia nuda TaxID=64659 RepID=A0A9P5YB06_9AGAR|nr:hypothetical protein BDZ94DRAFT_396148 [Collybia nuda]
MIFPALVLRDPENPSNCSDSESGLCASDLVILYIFAGIFMLIIVISALIWLGCPDTSPARKSSSTRRRLTRRKLSKKHSLMRASVSDEQGPTDSFYTGVLDPYHSMSLSFDDSLIFNKSSAKGTQIPELAYPASGADFLPPAYVPLSWPSNPEKGCIV